MSNNATRENVLDIAQELLQTRGYNAFSFRDLADRVQIKTASIHYYFRTKGELGRALVARHRAEVRAELARIEAEVAEPFARLEAYVAVFRSTLEAGNRMCLCGMLASDFATLEPSIVEDLRQSFRDHEAWLDRVLADGERSGALKLAGGVQSEARMLLSGLEGAMLVARTFEDRGRFESTARSLLARFRA